MQFLQLVISGIAQGCIYGLIALGLVLIYKATAAVSFGQGELMMLGAYGGLGFMVFLEFPFWAAMLGSIAAIGLLGLLLERTVIRPLQGQPALSVLLLTIGIGYVARGLMAMIPGIGAGTGTLPVPYKDQTWHAGPLVLNAEQMVVIGATAALCLLLFALLRHGKVGIAVQAASQNPLGACYMGIPVKRLTALAWGLASALAAVAGLLLAPITFVHANMGIIGLKALPAAVVGGFGSLRGAMAGGLVIGIVESLSAFYLPQGPRDSAAYVLVLIILIVKPHGLFGDNSARRRMAAPVS